MNLIHRAYFIDIPCLLCLLRYSFTFTMLLNDIRIGDQIIFSVSLNNADFIPHFNQ